MLVSLSISDVGRLWRAIADQASERPKLSQIHLIKDDWQKVSRDPPNLEVISESFRLI